MSNIIDVGRTLRLPNIPLPSAAVLGAILLIAAPLALYLYLYPYTEATLPFRNLRGPKADHGFFGSLLTINSAPIGSRYTDLTKEHGASTIRVRALLGKWRVVSTDTVAISHVLRHTGQWYRNEGFNGFIHRMTGDNVLCVEGDSHRRQRRILNSAFNASSVNGMMPMFWEEAYALKANVDQVGHRRRDKLTGSASPKARSRAPRSTCCRCTSARLWTLSAAQASTTTLSSTRTPTAKTRSPAPSTR